MSARRISLEDAARAVLGRDDEDDDEGKAKRGGRPPAKITLPRVKWL